MGFNRFLMVIRQSARFNPLRKKPLRWIDPQRLLLKGTITS
ncbi:hypothetical protein HMPREF1434_00784 [Helicobacter pylori GAMchJs124i]|nr:hypothetical protein HMPREF1434_00784 [Helicobacter pylori GAMchJs124i]